MPTSNKEKMKLKKLKEYLKKEKITSIKDFIVLVIGYGLMINYTLWALFNFPFYFYTFPAYGIFYYFVREELVRWIRRIIYRR